MLVHRLVTEREVESVPGVEKGLKKVAGAK